MTEGLNFAGMGSKMCLNEVCGKTTSSEWKQGWRLNSGGFATLCQSCGLAYENSVFCESFHSDESGWRQCNMCGKRIHCGCIASMYLHEILDFGGVACKNCITSDSHSMRSMQTGGDDNPNAMFVTNGLGAVNPMAAQNRNDDETFCFERLLQMTNAMGPTRQISNFNEDGLNTPLVGPTNTTCFPNFSQNLTGSSTFMRTDISRQKEMAKELFEPLNQPSLNFSLSSSPGGSKPVVPHFPGGVVEAGELNLRGPMGRDVLPNPRKPSTPSGHEAKRGSSSQTRVARPPAEGRGRNQLLPRYWPKITDQELKQLSGHLNSTIVPLFEKVLSASDAGRIGRLVLPKACAEAYFPPINQSEGIPIRIQDIKGKEWTFQFRFWPNNNSRMYVLEGVTPCIQNMQVQAGDIVTFSRIEPGNQLVIGCRKALDNNEMQDQQTALPSDDSLAEMGFSGPTDNLPSNGAKTNDQNKQHMGVEKKKSRNMKNKRLHMNNDDALMLSVTWEEAQELLRPAPNCKPTIVVIDGVEFEEYEEPPVFGKRTLFVTNKPSGEEEQWTQCDNCLKWRRLALDVNLYSKWTCADNIWDPKRSSCSVPEDINPNDLNALLKPCKESKKRRSAENKGLKEGESSGLDALATAAVLGDNMEELAAAEVIVNATTRHPRHRPGCTCIVCIQPPSGKGKHDPSCECNVCSTVKRRFKTLMQRKKQRQSAELALGKDDPVLDAKLENEEAKLENEDEIARQALLRMNLPENGTGQIGPMGLDEDRKEGLDLNCNPGRGKDPVEAAKLGLMALTKHTDAPSEKAAVLKIETTPSSEQDAVSQAAGPSGEQHNEEKELISSGGVEPENKVEEKENKVEEN